MIRIFHLSLSAGKSNHLLIYCNCILHCSINVFNSNLTTIISLLFRQFPIRICGGMTANRAQGQGFSTVGIYLKQDMFSHGQLYVGLSRATNPRNVTIFKPKDPKKADDSHLYMKNVVWKQVL